MRTREHALLMHRSHSLRAIIPPRRPPLAPADRLSMPSAGKRKATHLPLLMMRSCLTSATRTARSSRNVRPVERHQWFVLVPGTFWPDCSAAEQRIVALPDRWLRTGAAMVRRAGAVRHRQRRLRVPESLKLNSRSIAARADANGNHQQRVHAGGAINPPLRRHVL